MTRSRLALVVFALFLIGVIATADTGRSRYFGWLDRVPMGDKLGHGTLMFTLSLLANLATGRRTFRLGRFGPVSWATAVVTLLVVGEEVSQIWVPGRTFDLLDLTADLIGIALGDRLTRRILTRAPRPSEVPSESMGSTAHSDA